MDAVTVYLMAGILWAFFCVRVTYVLNRKPSWYEQVSVFIFNCITWPASMLWAIWKCPLK